jgi:hypothetical protein
MVQTWGLNLLRDRLFQVAVALGPPVAWGYAAAFGLSRPVDPVTLFWLLLAAPILEEAAFRGAVQPTLGRVLPDWRLGGLSAANLVTSSLFALVHLAHQPPTMAAAIMAPSLLLGMIYERSGRLAPCMVLHGWYNLCLVLAASA